MTPDRRPSLGPPPPVGGAAMAVRTAVRRRRARRWAAAGTASLAALAVGAVVAVGGGGTAALDTEPRDLDSATEPTATADPSSAPTPSSSPTPTAAPTSAATPGEGAAGEPDPDDPEQGGEDDPQPTSAADPSYRTPEMRRSSSTRTRPTGGPTGPVFCGGSVSGSGEEQVDGQLGWCVTVTAEPTREGHRFDLEICRDDSSDGRLTFPGSRETEMVVRRGDDVVWTWSADHPDRDEPHVLEVPSGRCWTWTVDFTDVDQSGRGLPSGTYAMTAATTATELDTGGDGTAEFVLA